MIRKGHDGPARRGKLQFSDGAIDTPSMIGPADSVFSQLKYEDLKSNSQSRGEYTVYSTGSILDPDELLEHTPENSLYLLPSLLGTSNLPSSVATEIIQSQIDFFSTSTLDPSRVILRIPSNLEEQDLLTSIERIEASGIFMVSFTFNGALGPNDLNNLRIRSKLPRNWVCIALGRIRPSVVPLLHYLGFDIIDFGYAYEAASQSIRLWEIDAEVISQQHENRYCSCVFCHDLDKEKDESGTITILENHNAGIYKQILSSSIHAAMQTKLRWHVESMTHASPEFASFLRKVDSLLLSFSEEFTPSHADQEIPLIGPESYYAPIVSRFRQFVAQRYSPSPEKRIVLLLPCSARKPYSDSKSHRRFAEVLDRALGSKHDLVAETIVTSPLGIVPRELERIYPAGYYDIPVSGDWDAEETSIAAEALVTHLAKFDESVVVIAHVSGGYLDVVQLAEDRIKQTIIYTTHDASATSRESLQSLKETLLDVTDRFESPSKRVVLEDTIRSTADYMFGSGAGHLLVPSGAKVGGKVYGSIICRVGKEQTCLFSGANGSISLTLEGGKRLSSMDRYWVRFEGTQIEGSTLFAVGIEDADDSIRPGDEVIILDKDGKVIGVGRSEMSGKEMCDFKNGLAVKVRHKER